MKAKRILSLLGLLAFTVLISCKDDTPKPKPISGFTASKTSVTVGDEVQFTNTSTNAISYTWNFGDGTTSILVSPTKIYTQVGVFTVTLVATGEGGTASSTMDITVVDIVIPPPVPNFTASKTSVIVNEVIQFTNTTTGATSYAWNFGDGTTSTLTDPTKAYAAAGVFTVTLVATGDGGSESKTLDITVVEGVIPKPIVSFTASKTNAAIGEEIQFTNTTQNADSYIWRFGDGTTSTLVAPVKTYDAAGDYTVMLVATNGGGSDSTSLAINIYALPTASFTVSTTSTVVGVEIQFTNTSQNATSYNWDFGDGTSSIETSPAKTYDAAGTYTVTLTASSDNGSDTETLEITVIAANSESIYFIDSSDELIQQLILDGSGTLITVKDVAGMSGVGIAYDGTGKIYFSDFFDADTPNGKIWKMNLDGSGAEAIVTGILDPYGIALDVTGGKIYWADDAGNISRVNLDGTDLQIGIVNIAGAMMRAVALDTENNKMYFYDVNAENLYVSNLDGTNATVLISGVYGYAIFIDTVNDKIYFDDQNTPGLRRSNLDGTSIEAVDDTDTRIYGITIDYEVNKLYWSARDMGEIYRADLNGANQEILKTGLTSPRGIFLKK